MIARAASAIIATVFAAIFAGLILREPITPARAPGRAFIAGLRLVQSA